MKNSHPLIAFARSGECGIIKLYRLTADFDARDVLTEYYLGTSESRRPSRVERAQLKFINALQFHVDICIH